MVLRLLMMMGVSLESISSSSESSESISSLACNEGGLTLRLHTHTHTHMHRYTHRHTIIVRFQPQMYSWNLDVVFVNIPCFSCLHCHCCTCTTLIHSVFNHCLLLLWLLRGNCYWCWRGRGYRNSRGKHRI